MTRRSATYLGVAAVAIAALSASLAITLGAQPSAGAVRIDADDIGGVVSGSGGPEAGVWVIAETTDLPTRFARSVVTDDQGRYVVPDLPKARYKVWVRGYGLVDSPKIEGEPGKQLNLSTVPAPNAAAAAQYYPAIYWYSMLKIPGSGSRLAVRGPDNPSFCKKGSGHPSAKLFPLERTNRALAILDPKTMQYTFVDTCFQTHHLQFGYDANDTLWTSGGAQWSAG